MKANGVISILYFLLVLGACTPSTQLTKTWVDPNYNATTAKPFKKILVIAKMKDEATRRIAEDKIASQFLIDGIAVQSYNYLHDSDTNVTQIEERLRKDGFDGIIRMRLAEVEKSVNYTPGTPYYPYGPYGGWYGGYGYPYYSQGYYTEDKTFYVETNVYSLEPNNSKLLWSGTTATVDPTSLNASLNDIIRVVKEDLQKKGLIKGNIKPE